MPHALWRGDAIGSHVSPSVSSGHPKLDRELPGHGWPSSVLTELLWNQNGSGEFRLLAPVLKQLSRAGKTIILLAPPHLVFAPALEQLGIDIEQVLLVQSEKPADRLWAVEQVLKSASFGALLCWLPQARPDHLRRLQLAAAGSEGLTFVFRPATAQQESSPAPLRLLCQAGPEGQISVEVIKRRGPVASAPIIIRPELPAIIERNIGKLRFSSSNPSFDFPHAMDSRLPLPTAAGSRLSSLA
ncbi:translesion DNA synthesis-associated protein ImuA [Noviherbaspirillum humi]|nr:translesion DNA synthesis-associated protein ImuA [Noviherbaspirillum humi]